MDIITASKPQSVLDEPSAIPLAAKVPPRDNPIPTEPVDFMDSDNPKVRTKLRLYSILSALYVAYPALFSLHRKTT